MKLSRRATRTLKNHAERVGYRNQVVTKSGVWAAAKHDITEPMHTFVPRNVAPPRG